MSDTPKVSAAEALEAAKLVDQVMRSDFWLWQDHEHPPTQAALRAIQSVRSFLESAASRPEGDDSALLDKLEAFTRGNGYLGVNCYEGSQVIAVEHAWILSDGNGPDTAESHPSGPTLRAAIRTLPEEEKENG